MMKFPDVIPTFSVGGWWWSKIILLQVFNDCEFMRRPLSVFILMTLTMLNKMDAGSFDDRLGRLVDAESHY